MANKKFLDSAFTPEEQKAILITDVDNSKSQGYWNTNGGRNAQDQMFLLSCAEVKRYFGVETTSTTNEMSRITATAYAKSNGANTSGQSTADGEKAGWWWLRSPGYKQDVAANVYDDGSLYYHGVNSSNGCVRPALWINLESDIF